MAISDIDLANKIDPRAVVERSIADPVWFFEKLAGWPLTNYQARILEAVRDNQTVSVRSAHSIGKTYLAARIGLYWITTRPNSAAIIVGPAERVVKLTTMREARSAAEKLVSDGIWPAGSSINKLQLDNGIGFMVAYAPGSEESGQGIHQDNVLLISEESSGIESQTWNALAGMEASGDVRTLMIGNPLSTDPGNRFYNSFKGKIPGCKNFAVSVFDTPNFIAAGIESVDQLAALTARQVSKIKNPNKHLVRVDWAWSKLQEWGPDNPLFAAKVEGNFWSGGDVNSLIDLARLEQCVGADLPDKFDSIRWGVDPARFGDDTAAVIKIGVKKAAGNQPGKVAVLGIWEFNKLELTELVGRVVRLVGSRTKDLIAVDSIGLGAGVVDMLGEQGYRVLPINVSGSGYRSDHHNLRYSIFDGLASLVIAGNLILPENDRLQGELANIRYKVSSAGKLILESKAEMKARTGRSPDLADALAVGCWGINFGHGDMKSRTRWFASKGKPAAGEPFNPIAGINAQLRRRSAKADRENKPKGSIEIGFRD